MFFSVILCNNLNAQEHQSIDRRIILSSNVDSFANHHYYITKRFALNGEAFKSDKWRLFYRDTDAEIDIDSIIYLETKILLIFKVPELVFYDEMRVSLRNYLLSEEEKIEESNIEKAANKTINNKRITCSSSMSAMVTADWTGGGCNICSSSTPTYSCSSFGTWGMGIQTFTDPLPSGAFVESISVEVFGVGGCSGANTTTVIVAGSTLGTGALPGSCSCNSCFSFTESSTYASCSEPSGYVYGGVNTIQLTASGGIICVDYAEITITYCMNAAPVITCPPNSTFECDGMGNVSDINAWLGSVSASDVNDSIVSITNNYDASNFMDCNNTGSQLVTFIATDNCGNSDTCMATLTIEDTTAPSLPAAPSDVNGQCSNAVPAASDLTATDNCDGSITVSPTDETISGSCPNSYVIKRKWIFEDGCGNKDSIVQTITIEDTTAPGLPDAPSDVTGECSSDVPASMDLMAMDNCDGNIMVSPTDETISGSCPNSYVIKRKWIFEDGCGNKDSIVQTITIEDTTAPGLPGAPSDVTGECSSDVPASMDLMAMDNCDGNIMVSPTDETISGSCPNSYVIKRKWIFEDGCGNKDSIVQTITIEDTTAPGLPDAPSDVTGECSSDVPASMDLMAMDNCDGNIMVSPTDETISGSCPNSYVIKRKWLFEDGCGNKDSIVQTITIEDTTAPGLPGAPSDVTGECSSDVPAASDLTATDNCDGNITVSPTDETISGSCPNSYVIKRKWIFEDGCGNKDSIVQTITIEDTTAPGLPGAPSDVTGECSSDVPAASDLTATDNCDGNITVSPTDETISGSCPNSYVIKRKWLFEDGCGNKDSIVQTITIEDTTAPGLPDAPSNVTGECSNAVPVASDLTATDNCDGNIMVSPTDETISGSCPNSYVIKRKWLFEDGCGNKDSIVQTITIEDTTAPGLPGAPSDVTGECSSDVPASMDLMAMDNCDGNIMVSPTDETISGSCPNSYVIKRKWLFEDGCGNKDSIVQTITIEDTTAPGLPGAPSDVTGECSSDVPASMDLMAMDNCDGNITVSPTDETISGSCPNSYVIKRKWLFEDGCGNKDSIVQTITIEDTTAPGLPDAPSDVTGECSSDVPASMDLMAMDNCDGNITVSPTDETISGSCPNSYVIKRKWIFEDGCGNKDSIVQTITIEDTTAPGLPDAPSDVTGECSSDVPAASDLTATDNCDGNITVSPTDETISGSCPNSYVIKRKWLFEDGCGNKDSIVQTITIEDTTAPGLPGAPSDVTGECSSDVPASMDLMAMDNCDGNIMVSPTDETISGSCPNSYVIKRKWIFEDGCGNKDSIVQTITIEDTTAPGLPGAPSDVTGECSSDVPASMDLMAMDNCDGNITVSPTDETISGSCPNSYVIKRKWIFEDGCGNKDSIVQTITIEDTTAPGLPGAPSDVTGECSSDVPAASDLTATDNCDGNITVSPTDETISGSCPNSYVIKRKWLFEDGCGNKDSIVQTITIEDTTAPGLPGAPSDVTGECSSDVPASMDLMAMDNCDGNIMVSPTDETISGSCPNSYVIKRKWLFEDGCGNKDSIVQTITIEDTTAPGLPDAPSDVTGECSSDVPASMDLMAMDNCDGNIMVSPTDETISGSCPNSYVIKRKWLFEDGCGNKDSIVQTITIEDTTAPGLPGAPSDVTGECSSDVPASMDLMAMDNCDGNIMVSPTDETISGSCPNSYVIKRKWLFEDGCGNKDSIVQTITIEDTTAPGLPGAPSDVTGECSSDVPASMDLMAMDNCDGNIMVSPTDETISGSCPNSYVIKRKWLFEDGCGNKDSIVQTITIEDTTAPGLPDAPSDVTGECSSDVPASMDLMAMDNCDGNITVSPTDETISGSCPNSYVIKRKWIFEDGCGNKDSIVQTITIEDTTAPGLPGAPSDVTGECSSDVPASMDLMAMDNCDGNIMVSPTDETISGSCPNSYVIKRKWLFEDGCGNKDSIVQTITIEDTTAPGLPDAPSDVTGECSSDVPASMDLMAMDNCDGNIMVSPTDETISGSCPNSYVIKRKWLFEDGCGNKDSIVQTITIEDTTAPGLPSAPSDVTGECSSDVPAASDLTATDNCDGNITVSPTDETISGSCPNSYVIKRKWIFEDGCGNKDSIVQTITIEDTTAPGLPGAPSDVTGECSSDVPASMDLMAMDNCDGNIMVSPTDETISGSCPNSYVIKRKWLFEDGCGNKDSIVQTITIEDTTAPGLPDAPSDVTGECSNAVPVASDLTATDNCDGNIMVSPTDETISGSCPNSYVIKRKWIFEDGCGNKDSIVQTITIEDTTAPGLPSAPSDVTGECSSDVPAASDLTATDNCDGNITVSPTDETISGSCPNSYVIKRKWIFEDGCGNKDSIVQTITIEDTTAPGLPGAPSDVTGECSSDVPAASDLTATDNCDGNITVSPTDETISGSCPNSYVIKRKWIFEDGCGNKDSIVQTITIEDTTAPGLPDAPSDVTGECSSDVPAASDLTATDNCDGNITVSPTDETISGSCPNSYVIKRKWLFEDGCGNKDSIVQTITIEDTTAPGLPGAPSDVTGECSSDVPASMDLMAMDNCDGNIMVSPTDETISGSCPNSYVIKRKWLFEDGCGNKDSIVQTITIEDTTAPGLPGAPSDVTGECSSDVPASMDLMAMDNCDGNITVSPTDETISGSCPNSYVIKRKWIFEDGCGNKDSIVQTITIEDTTAPGLPGAPSDVTGECSSDVPAASDLTATDNCDGNITVSPTDETISGSCPNSYVIKRKWLFEDGCGNKDSIVQTITIEDTTAPGLPDAPSDVTGECSNAVPVASDLTATDNCDGNIMVSPTDETISGSCPNSYVIKRKWIFEDGCGNKDSIVQTITIEDTTAPGLPDAPSDVTGECSSDVPAASDLTATDNCDGNIMVSPTDETISGSCPNSYVIKRKWLFEDGCGNKDSIVQTITIEDTTAPGLPSAPSDVTGECSSDVPAASDLTATDNCDGNITVSPTDETISGSCPNSYVIKRKWIFEDGCGNKDSIVQTITIEDTTAPGLPDAPSDVTGECSSDVPAASDLTAIDNCDGNITVSPTDETISGSCPNSYVIKRKWLFEDGCGNKDSIVQTITIEDTTAPGLPGAPSDVTGECSSDVPASMDLMAMDNCDGNIMVSPTDETISGSCPNSYVIKRKWLFEDGCGNKDSIVQTITIEDTTAPGLPDAPSDVTGECSSDVPASMDLMAMDNCDGNIMVSPTDETISGSCPNSYVIKRKWLFEDGCGNKDSIVQTITIEDTTAPGLPGAPSDVTGECSSDVPASMDLMAMDNCDGNITVSPTDETISGSCPNSYVIKRKWIFEDGCGNKDSIVQTITIEDTTAPGLPGAPSDVTGECSSDVPAASDLTATDNCDGNITVSPTDETISGSCPNSYVIKRKWLFEDGCGNKDSIVQTITIEDTTAPGLPDAPSDVTGECSNAVPVASDLTATDNCDGNIMVSPTDETISGSCPNSYVIKRKWLFEDGCGNKDSIVQTITIEDTTAPGLPSAPSDVTGECSSDVPAASDLTATDNCDGNITVSPTDETISGSCPNSYVIKRKWIFEDGCGNKDSIVQTITIEDTTAPGLPGAPSDVTGECSSDVPAASDLTATDNCDGNITVSPTDETISGSCPNSYVIKRKWIFEDGCGNKDSIVQTITIEDTTAPGLPDAPSDVTGECSSDVPAASDLTATDNCDGNITVSPTDETISGSCPNSYVIKRKWLFEDGCGNKDSIVQTITIEDTTAPGLPGAPSDVTGECSSDVPASMDLMAMDNCDGNIMVSPTDETISGSCPNSYVIKRKWLFEDGCGNKDSIVQTITIEDTTAPGLPDAPSDVTGECSSDVPASMDLMAMDNCDGNIMVSPTDETISGSCPNSYVIKRKWIFEDGCGNKDSIVQTITIEDTTAPGLPDAPSDVTGECSSDVPAASDLTATDNCDGNITVSPTDETISGSCPNSYVIKRKWIFEDGCGNKDSIVQTITIEDTTAPGLPDAPLDVTGECSSDVPASMDLMAMDNCDGNIMVSPTDETISGSCPNSYVIKRKWLFEDGCGNKDSIVQTITIEDTTAPGLPDAPSDVTGECSSDVPASMDLMAMDNCDGNIMVSPTDETISGSCPNSYVIKRKWIFEDGCGNKDSIVQTITIEDTTAPGLPDAPSDVTGECSSDVPASMDLMAMDNCDGNITVSPTDETISGSCPNSYVIKRKWIFEDGCGNKDSIVQTITIEDTTAPGLPDAPSDVTGECSSDVPAASDLTATDNCDGNITVSPTDETISGSCPNSYVIKRKWLFEDGCGNKDSIVQTITIEDTTAPGLPGAPSDVTGECSSDVPASMDLMAMDNCDGNITVSPTDETISGSCPNSYVIKRKWIFEDGCGNKDSIVQTITIEDTTAPGLPGAPSDVTGECSSDVPASMDLMAMDNCDGNITVSPTDETISGSCPNSYVIKRKWIFEDGCGNKDSIVQTITIEDTTAPGLPDAPSDVTGECSSDVPAASDLTATDNCDGNITVSPTDETISGSCPNSYVIKRKWLFEDGCGNKDSIVQTITIEDTTAPGLPGAPSNVTGECSSDVPAASDLTATDNCDGNITVSPTDETISGSCPNSYVIKRKWLFEDGCGNKDSIVQTITIEDTTAPGLPGAPSDVTGECSSDVPAASDLTATDNCDGNITVSPTADTTAGSCVNDFTIVRTWTFIDACGNSSNVSQTITISDTSAPVLSGYPQDTTVFCAPDIPGDQGVTAIDNCEGAISVVFTQNTDDSFPDSIIIENTWTASDCLGNESSHSQIVTYIPKQPELELTKSSALINSGANNLTQIGDTIFYEFLIRNTGNTPLKNMNLVDPILSQLECDSTSLQGGSQSMCSGYYIVTGNDINNGVVENSAIVIAEVIEGSLVRDTSDSGNLNDEKGTDSDQTFTSLNQDGKLSLLKSVGETNDLNTNGILDMGDEIVYKFKVINTGNVTIYGLSIQDAIVNVQGGLDSLASGDIDSLSFTAVYTVDEMDGENGYVENTAIISGSLPSSMGGEKIQDISDAGNDFEETVDANGVVDGDSSNDPVFICVVGPLNCPGNLEVSACLRPEEIELEFQNWINRFQGGGCDTRIVFVSEPELPEICGGSTTVEMKLVNTNGDTIPDFNCSSTFTIVEDSQAPLCPSNWDLTIISSNVSCTVIPYTNGLELFNKTGIRLSDNCTSFDSIQLSYTDSLLPYNCNASETFFPNMREVIRSYALTDACGNTSELCPQKLTFELDACRSLNTFGRIAINGLKQIEVQSTCDIPLIEVAEVEEGVCGYVEYMWLQTTLEDANGNPPIPTAFNIGTEWTLMPGETKPTLDLGMISQNTHYVRCARNFSCCDFGESNVVSVRVVNTNIPCPTTGGFFINKECLEAIELTSPENDYSAGQNIEHITNMVISAENKVGSESKLLLNAAQSTSLLKGFEVDQKAVLEVGTTGCKED